MICVVFLSFIFSNSKSIKSILNIGVIISLICRLKTSHAVKMRFIFFLNPSNICMIDNAKHERINKNSNTK